MIEIIFYDVMALVAMRIGRKCISGSELILSESAWNVLGYT